MGLQSRGGQFGGWSIGLEELENALLDKDDRAEMPPPSARSHGVAPLTNTVPVPALEGRGPSVSHSVASTSLPPRIPPQGNRGGGTGRR